MRLNFLKIQPIRRVIVTCTFLGVSWHSILNATTQSASSCGTAAGTDTSTGLPDFPIFGDDQTRPSTLTSVIEEMKTRLPNRPAKSPRNNELLAGLPVETGSELRAYAVKNSGPEIKRFGDQLKSMALGRSGVIDSMIIAAIVGGNVLFTGDPGNGKTYLPTLFMENTRVNGKKDHGTELFTEGTGQRELVGEPILRVFRNHGISLRNFVDSLFARTFVLLDEVFQAQGPILRALNTILENGIFSQNGEVFNSRLRTAFGATNKTVSELFSVVFRSDPNQATAVLDRYMFIFHIPQWLSNLFERSQLSKLPTHAQIEPLDVAHFEVIRQISNDVVVPEVYRILFDRLRVEFSKAQQLREKESQELLQGRQRRGESVAGESPYKPTRPLSDRTFRDKLLPAMRAHAALRWAKQADPKRVLEVHDEDFLFALKTLSTNTAEIDAQIKALAIAESEEGSLSERERKSLDNAIFEIKTSTEIAQRLIAEKDRAVKSGTPLSALALDLADGSSQGGNHRERKKQESASRRPLDRGERLQAIAHGAALARGKDLGFAGLTIQDYKTAADQRPQAQTAYEANYAYQLQSTIRRSLSYNRRQLKDFLDTSILQEGGSNYSHAQEIVQQVLSSSATTRDLPPEEQIALQAQMLQRLNAALADDSYWPQEIIIAQDAIRKARAVGLLLEATSSETQGEAQTRTKMLNGTKDGEIKKAKILVGRIAAGILKEVRPDVSDSFQVEGRVFKYYSNARPHSLDQATLVETRLNQMYGLSAILADLEGLQRKVVVDEMSEADAAQLGREIRKFLFKVWTAQKWFTEQRQRSQGTKNKSERELAIEALFENPVDKNKDSIIMHLLQRLAALSDYNSKRYSVEGLEDYRNDLKKNAKAKLKTLRGEWEKNTKDIANFRTARFLQLELTRVFIGVRRVLHEALPVILNRGKKTGGRLTKATDHSRLIKRTERSLDRLKTVKGGILETFGDFSEAERQSLHDYLVNTVAQGLTDTIFVRVGDSEQEVPIVSIDDRGNRSFLLGQQGKEVKYSADVAGINLMIRDIESALDFLRRD